MINSPFLIYFTYRHSPTLSTSFYLILPRMNKLINRTSSLSVFLTLTLSTSLYLLLHLLLTYFDSQYHHEYLFSLPQSLTKASQPRRLSLSRDGYVIKDKRLRLFRSHWTLMTYECVFVCIHIYLYVCVHTHTHTHKHAHKHTHTHIHTHTDTHAHTNNQSPDWTA